MRAVEAADAWRKATTRDRKFRATRVRTSSKPPLADFDADLPNGLVVVCGLNGVGKTTLLRLMFHALGGPPTSLRPELVDIGSFEIDMDIDGEQHTTLIDNGPLIGATLLDAAAECAHLFALARQPNFGDLADGFDAREWSSDEVTEARYVLGKGYTAIRVTEFEDPGQVVLQDPDGVSELSPAAATHGDPDQDNDDAVLALIEVDVGDLTYDYRTMGLGELAALILLWRLRRARPNTVVLLEEPETYLSASASSSLLDVLARVVNARRLYAVVTTHSPGLIRCTPLAAVRVLVPDDNHAAILRPPTSSAELEGMLGLPPGATRIILVEDETAATVVRELVGRFAGSWARTVAYLPTSGHERLLAVCDKLPETESLHLVGVLDGDQDLPAVALNWPVLLLPGPSNPDELLRGAILSAMSGFANLVGRAAEEVAAAAHVHAGLDEHDWFHELAKALVIEVHGLRRVAVGLWLNDPANETIAKALVAEILDALGGPQ